MRRPAAVALLAGLVLAAPATAAPRLTPIAPTDAFDQPVHLAAPPQDPHRVFVVEKPGRVKVVVDGGAPQTFLDIAAEVDEDGEEGLLSIAFAPDYATSRRFYAYFTAVDATMGGGSRIKIVEFTRPEATPNSAVGSTRRTLLEIEHPTANNHNGGQLQTGPDGLLWLATGDGAVSPANAQNTTTLLGKLLRIDPTPSPPSEYTIPPGNAFPGGVGGRPEIWAYGLRNPWRFSFDRQTGDLTLGDVGGGTREEINFQPVGGGAGANYGWPCWEGTSGPNCAVANHTPPVFDYDSNPDPDTVCGVMGGYVVRDPRLPTLLGRYLYTDLCRSTMRSLDLTQPAATDRPEPALDLGSTVSFGEDSCGHVYVVSIGGLVARVDDEPFTPCPEPGAGQPPGGTPPGQSPPGTSPPGGDPPPTPAADRTPPELRVSRARRQKLLARRRVRFAARCDEQCGLSTEANARLAIGGRLRKWSFTPTSRPAAASARQLIELKLTRAMRRALAARVRRGARPLG
jgi:hypothetical protein